MAKSDSGALTVSVTRGHVRSEHKGAQGQGVGNLWRLANAGTRNILDALEHGCESEQRYHLRVWAARLYVAQYLTEREDARSEEPVPERIKDEISTIALDRWGVLVEWEGS